MRRYDVNALGLLEIGVSSHLPPDPKSSVDMTVSAMTAVSLPPFGYPPAPSPLHPAPTAAGCGVPDEVVVSDNEMSLVSAIS